MKPFDCRNTRKSVLVLLLALIMTLSVCGAAFASGETWDASPEPPTDDLTAVADAHSLHLEGVPNAWQLGGYVTEDGKKVRDNVLMRSGNLRDATEEDIQMLSEDYHVTTIVDFRDPGEIEMKPDQEVPGAENINISLADSEMGGFEEFLAMLAAASAEASNESGSSGEASVRPVIGGAQPDMYTRMFVKESTLNGFREFIDLLLEQDEDSVILYHCSSGKDRTGTATLILLTLLGVDKDTILADFALTNVFMADEIESAVAAAREKTDDEEELALVAADTGVSVEYMELAFDQAEEECGNMLDYVKQQFHVTDEEIARLRELYLMD